MNVTSCEKKDNKIAELTVVMTAEEFEQALEGAYKKNRGQIAVPGFRKGKAPRKIIERMYGASVFYNDALDALLPTVFTHGVTAEKLKTVGYPKVTDFNLNDDKSAEVKFTVELYPEVKNVVYKGLSAVKMPADVDESAVDGEVESVRARNARIQSTTSPAKNGDTAVIDFEGFIDGVPFEGGKGENYDLVLGSNTFIPGFEDKILGMATGDSADLDLVFPQDYHEHLAGKPVVFKVTVKDVKESILPELDDEFVKDVSEFDTMAEYKKSIRDRLAETKREEADKAFENALMAKMAESVEAEIPDAMVEEHLDGSVQNMTRQLAAYGMDINSYASMMGMTPESFRDSMRASAVHQIKTTLGLEKIAELENITATDADIEAFYEDLAKKYKVEPSVVKESVPRETVEHEVMLEAASKIVCSHATVEAYKPAEEEAEKEPKAKKAKKVKTDSEAADNIVTEEKPEKPARAKKASADEVAEKPEKPARKKKAAPDKADSE
ncbi:trigger factor [Oscillospiraceae bacterium WX1]